ncbi:MAG TPA: ATP-binding protein, partial [Fimbriimonas sp.]
GPFHTSVYELRGALPNLRKSLQVVPSQRENVVRLERTIEDRLSDLTKSIEANRERTLDTARNIVLTDEADRAMDRIQFIGFDIQTAQNQLLAKQTRQRGLSQGRLALTFWLSTALNIGLVLIVSVLVRRIVDAIARERRRDKRHAQLEIARREELEAEVARRREAEAALNALNAELEMRVRERTRELTKAYEEAEAFNYTIAHDLRSPLRAIISASHILVEDHREELSDAAKHELLRQAGAAQRMARLIDDLLQLSKLSRQEIVVQRIDLSALASTVAAEMTNRSWSNPPEIVVQPGLSVEADPVLLEMMLVSLIENACKFSPEGGVVTVGSTESEGQTVFFVKDEGVGFDPSYVHRIFLPFERLVSQSEFDGTGIGLANVKRIMDRHGGRIWAESAPGQGACFYFAFAERRPQDSEPDPGAEAPGLNLAPSPL